MMAGELFQWRYCIKSHFKNILYNRTTVAKNKQTKKNKNHTRHKQKQKCKTLPGVEL